MAGHLTLLQGPVFSGKSQVAEKMIEDSEADLLVEYTALWASLRAVKRGKDGRFPIRRNSDPFNTIGNTLKLVITEESLKKGLRVIVSTGVSGEVEKWSSVAQKANASFDLKTVDPGVSEIDKKLIEAGDSEECLNAVKRWYPNYSKKR